MKKFKLSLALSLVFAAAVTASASAQAAPISCTTNMAHDPRLPETTVWIARQSDGQVLVTQRSDGGMAHFVTAPKTFPVTIRHLGPEAAVYTNADEGFELTIVFQPMGGREIRGTLITESLGARIDRPVACVMAMDEQS